MAKTLIWKPFFGSSVKSANRNRSSDSKIAPALIISSMKFTNRTGYLSDSKIASPLISSMKFTNRTGYLCKYSLLEPIVAVNAANVWRAASTVSIILLLHNSRPKVPVGGIEDIDRRNRRNKLLALNKSLSFTLFAIGLGTLTFVCGKEGHYIAMGVAIVLALKYVAGNLLIKFQTTEGKMIEGKVVDVAFCTAEKFKLATMEVSKPATWHWHSIVKKVFLKSSDDNLDKFFLILEDIKSVLISKSYVFLGEQAPYCCISEINNSNVELSIGCNVYDMAKDAEHDMLIEVLRVIEQHKVEVLPKHTLSTCS